MKHIKIDKDKIERFVLYDSEKALRPDDLSVVNYYSLFFSAIAIIYGVVGGGIYLAIAVFMTVLAVAYIPAIEVLKRRLRHSLQTGFICNSFISLFSLVFFAAFGLLFFVMYEPTLLQCFLLIVVYVLVFGIYYFITMWSIYKDVYSRLKARPNNAANAAAIGAALGMVFVQFFLADLDKDTVLFIAGSIWFLVSLMFVLGTVNILKYYYCKKYGFEEIYFVQKPKKRLKKKMGKVKKVLLILLGITALFFAVALTIGWLAQHGYIN